MDGSSGLSDVLNGARAAEVSQDGQQPPAKRRETAALGDVRAERWLKTSAVWVLIFGTFFGLAMLSADIYRGYFIIEGKSGSMVAAFQVIVYAACGSVLVFGAIAHLTALLGYLRRLKLGKETYPINDDRVVGVLIPSYREEVDVVLRTLLSTALQSYGNKWITLLVDDPPVPSTEAQRQLLAGARRLPKSVEDFLRPFVDFIEEAERNLDPARGLVNAHSAIADRFAELSVSWDAKNHEDRFFARSFLGTLAKTHADRARCLRESQVGPQDAINEIRTLKQRFCVSVTVFERKRYANLSHAANKAMNLNAYIGLLGRRFAAAETANGIALLETDEGEIKIPSADYLVTVDADSVILPCYIDTLVGVMEAPGNARLAVAQTPYAAFPDAPSDLERVAGATTDVQRILHQGFTNFDASFWVGANAVLRVDALNDIRQEVIEDGKTVVRFIQDRTVIEDTESTIDLAEKGWSVWNHMDILAYSATPPDFGSLTIQRRRWACGGLLILPKAIRNILAGRPAHPLAEGLLRLHYLGSLAWTPLSVIVLLVLPFDPVLISWALPAAAFPYFIGYTWSLWLAGRSPADIFKVYGLNLLLIFVNLSGAFASIRQGISGKKVPFQRTPKVGERTALSKALAGVIWIAPIVLLVGSIGSFQHDAYLQGILAGANAFFFALAAQHFIGIKESLQDLKQRRQMPRGSIRSLGDQLS